MFSYRQIEYFVITIEQGSISGAALALGVSPQAISKAINDMEQDLERSLFTRKASGLKPTPYGMSLYKRARKMIADVHDFENFARGGGENEASTIRLLLCAPKFANFNLVSERIRAFIQKYTNCEAKVKRAGIDECMEKLSTGAVDAFVTIGKTDLRDFEVHTIDSIDVGVLLNNSHPYVGRSKLHVADFADVPLYLTPTFTFFYETVLESLRRASKGEGIQLRSLDMSIYGIYNALVREKGCVAMPNIHGVDNWMPEASVVPFDSSEIPMVPLCLVTDKHFKTQSCKTLERLLLERPLDGLRFD